jgi:transketolase
VNAREASKMVTMRDAFFNKLFELARKDPNIILVDADMGAPSLDKFRTDVSAQFVNVGIAEQNAITVACGLALGGKIPFAYAIAPFITLRCYEQIKVDMCAMKLPVTCIGVGAGFSYEDSGPTHHTTEDISIMRALPNITILNSSDSIMAEKCAEIAVKHKGPMYVRLDRESLPNLYNKNETFKDGVHQFKKGKDVCIISTGNMLHKALEVSNILKKQKINVAVVDLYRLKPVNKELLVKLIKQSKKVVTLEEHLIDGGLGSIIAEIIVDKNLKLPLKRLAIPDKYCYTYGGREAIRKTINLDTKSVVKAVKNFVK